MRFFIYLIFLIFCIDSFAQQDPQYTMFWNNYSIYNPAASGVFEKHYAAINGRKQWTNFPGAPNTLCVLYDVKTRPLHGGAGLNYTYDELGFMTSHRANWNYSFIISLKNGARLGIGTSVGFHHLTLNNPTWITPDTIYDPSIPLGGAQGKLNSNTGIMFEGKKLRLGFSCTNIIEPYFERINLGLVRHYYLMASYKKSIGTNGTLIPNLFIKSDASSTQLDINLLYDHNNLLWAGVGYRMTDAIYFMAGVNLLHKFRIGYSYDYTTSSLAAYSNGSHEIVLAFIIKEMEEKE